MHKPYDVYCDMDGVLVDFYTSVIHTTGKAFDDPYWNGKERAAQRAALLHGSKWWADLRPMPDFDQLWHWLKNFDPDILTAYARWDVENSKHGKVMWNHKYLHVAPSKFHMVARESKQHFATLHGKPCLLIDDFPNNIKEWERRGGVGIIHKNASSTIAQMQALGYSTAHEVYKRN